MRALSPKLLRELQGLLGFIIDSDNVGILERREAVRLLPHLNAALKPKRAAAPARKRRTQKAKTRREAVAELRARVVERAAGMCECGCGCTFIEDDPRWRPELDHFHSGSNRRAMESFEGCWLLTWTCHHLKHRCATPHSVVDWLQRFLAHSEKHRLNGEPQRLARMRLAALELQARAP